MEIKIEDLVRLIVKEVIAELSKNGIVVNLNSSEKILSHSPASQQEFCETINMKNYKSPVLTENHINSLNANVREIIIPKRTVITPGARDAIAKRRLKVTNSH